MEEPPIIEPPGHGLLRPSREGRNPFVWLFDLYFRPSRALDARMLGMGGGSLALIAWIVGAAGVADRASTRAEAGAGLPQLSEEWAYFWGYVIGGGVIAGLIAAFVPSLWYHLRIRMSGGRCATFRQTRRLYLSCGLIWALPALVGTAASTVAYDTPREAAAGLLWPLLGIAVVTPFWSVIASYRGARATLGTRRWPSVFWLLALPSAFYIAAFGVVAAASLLGGAKPDFDNPQAYRTPALRHSLIPGNWVVGPAEDEWTPSWSMDTNDESGSTSFTARMMYAGLEKEERLEEIVANLENAGAVLQSRRSLRSWGGRSGAGALMKGEFEGAAYELRVLVFNLEEGVDGEFIGAAPTGNRHASGALERLAGMITFTPIAEQKADVRLTTPWHNRYFSVTVPGNWHREPMEEEEGLGPGLDSTSPQGSYHRAMVFDTDGSPMEEVLRTVQMHAGESSGATILESPDAYGSLACVGQLVRIEQEGAEPYTLGVYVTPLADGRMLEINEIALESSAGLVRPGFDLLRDSLALKPGVVVDEARLLAPPGEPDPAARPSPRF